MQTESPPSGLQALLSGITPDFLVKSKRAKPLKQALGGVAVSLLLLIFLGIFSSIFLAPLFTGQTASMEVNGVLTTYGPGNWTPIFIPGILIGFFFLFGTIFFVNSILLFIRPGNWFAGTPENLIQWNEKKVEYHEWDMFTGSVKVFLSDIDLELKSGKLVHSKNQPDRFVPGHLYIVGQSNAQQIVQYCLRRINASERPVQDAIR